MIKGVSCFSKSSIMDVWQGSEYASSSEYPRVLNSPGFWIYLWFWMCQSFGYTRVLNMPLVLNIPGFWICLWFWIYQGSEYARITQGSQYALIIPEYAGICGNMPKSVWMAFVLHLFERPQETRGYSLKDHENVFLKRQNLILFCFFLV